ncbi:FUSC family protein [Aureibacter tunicatorum]|uniref:Uncharacterized membrane protein YgaE (UPF0421/DUF939 family) n=1 Tax=Aureibacter tunicatorum TaxID=866807 RepID=A0AAE3XL82_9BACT|nr:FUSC family protein [Aureibacter tunicatorum]MDR6237826.1 uncharacterized membrane protein YgaE (UPF0421/DUF939 family) [Aureibacter tunicatorum]BDD02862.1 hypothetical protein AUTU_03450 [Aureibacter tunicatorum]
MFYRSKSLEKWVYNHVERVHLIKLLVLVVSAFLAARLLEIPHGSWISGTCLVLSRPVPQFGGILHRAVQRIMGTFMGAALSLLTMFVTSENVWVHTIALGVAFPLFALWVFPKDKYAYQVAILTMLIVMSIGTDLSQDAAMWRAINIGIGGMLSLSIIFVFPIQAKVELRYLLADCLAKINQLYLKTSSSKASERSELEGMNTDIITSIRKQRKIFPYLVKESRFFKKNEQRLDDIAISLRKMSGILELLGSSLFTSERGNQVISQLYSIKEKEVLLSERLDEISQLLERNEVKPLPDLRLRLRSSKQELYQLNHQGADENAPLSPFSYIWLHHKFGEEIFKLEGMILELFEAKAKNSKGLTETKQHNN